MAEEALARADALEAGDKNDLVSALVAKACGGGLIGTPELIAERIKSYEALGVECLMLTFHPMMEGMERFAAEVMPLLGRGRTQIKMEEKGFAARH
jgi:FMNH2-dependent dimethyl sulfone monooxygenase